VVCVVLRYIAAPDPMCTRLLLSAVLLLALNKCTDYSIFNGERTVRGPRP